MGGVVETNQPRRVLGCEAGLGAETGPQALPAPFDLVREPADPDLSMGPRQPSPSEGDLGIDRPARLVASGQLGLGDGETLIPRRGRVKPLLESSCVASPQVIERDDRSGQMRGSPEHGVREHRRQPQLQGLDALGADSNIAGGDTDDQVAAPVPALRRAYDESVAEVDGERDGRERDHRQVDGAREAVAEPGHAQSRDAPRL
jgi:hypothetical protein